MRIISKRSLNLTPSFMHSAISCVQKENKNGLSGWLVKQVNCAPNESITWEKLTDPYIDLSQYEFTLNLCSMSTLDSRCMHHSLPAPKILLPSHRTNTELPEQETASVGHAENIGTSLCKRVRDPFKLRLGKRKQDRCCIWFDSRGFLTSDYRDAVGVVYGSA